MTKQMTARYNGKCSKCGEAIHVGEAIVWNSESHSARHAECPAAVVPVAATETVAATIDIDAARSAARTYLSERDRLYWDARDDEERYGGAERLRQSYRRQVAAAGMSPDTNPRELVSR